MIMAERHGLCEECVRQGKIAPGSELHHLVALRDGGAKFARDNVELLCKSCHSRETMRAVVGHHG